MMRTCSGSMPVMFLMNWDTAGMRVAPPTRSTLDKGGRERGLMTGDSCERGKVGAHARRIRTQPPPKRGPCGSVV